MFYCYLKCCRVPSSVPHNVPDVPDQDGEDEDAHQPRGRHEQDLGHVGGLLVLADGGGSLGGEVKAPGKLKEMRQ